MKTRSLNSGGFTLIEALIGIAVTSIVLSGIFMAFLKSSDTYRYAMELADIQERGRFAISFLKEAIQTADYKGCRQDAAIFSQLVSVADYNWNFTVGIQGFDVNSDDGGAVAPGLGVGGNANWTPALATNSVGNNVFSNTPVQTGDAISVRGSVGTNVQLAADMANTGANITIPAASDTFSSRMFMMASDCAGAGAADVFQLTNAVAGDGAIGHAAGGGNPNWPGNQNGTLNTAYTTTSQLTPVQSSSFFIRQSGSGMNSLSVRRDGRNVDDLIEGVDGMQVLYGVDMTPGDGARAANQYLRADEVAAIPAPGGWSDVVSVRIALLVRSMKAAARQQSPQTYNLLGVTYGPYPDWNRRRAFVTTISLRNRMR